MKFQKVLIGSLAFTILMTSLVMPGVLANSSNTPTTHVTAKSEKPGKNANSIKKQEREAEKAAIRATYSEDELAKLKLAGDKIKKNNKNVAVLPVENIIVKGAKVKFDTPPVIKSGRTLIPVKALSEAFGAEVKWISAERKVVITKDSTEIVLQLDNNKIYVNGVESTIDVPACSINGRTVVPIKFIVEKMGLLVKWDSDSQVVEIENPTPTVPAEPTTTPAEPTTTPAQPTTTPTEPTTTPAQPTTTPTEPTTAPGQAAQ
ncbi:copper amine oxidase N-terminal domain-containing protein [Clostridium sp. BNL1100]|uniref:copper amine oxidase N-terminal domain-containing protein n=1 Tax=Clostridium sp. BNL1100 TaxID=755731 RepID=UPI00024A7D18|nr:copper amine oxidase N-terminal domain-containing protein [Clostridium sp. BNL1100]AEY67103.1 copper amine oxidase family protein [Clostridium sp. BNL1100]